MQAVGGFFSGPIAEGMALAGEKLGGVGGDGWEFFAAINRGGVSKISLSPAGGHADEAQMRMDGEPDEPHEHAAQDDGAGAGGAEVLPWFDGRFGDA